MSERGGSSPIWAHQRREGQADADLVAVVRTMIDAQRAIGQSLPRGFVQGSAVDILFCLYVEHAAGRRSTFALLAGHTMMMPSTLDRWIKAPAQAGMVIVTPIIGNDELVELTDQGWEDVSRTARSIRAQTVMHGNNTIVS